MGTKWGTNKSEDWRPSKQQILANGFEKPDRIRHGRGASPYFRPSPLSGDAIFHSRTAPSAALLINQERALVFISPASSVTQPQRHIPAGPSFLVPPQLHFLSITSCSQRELATAGGGKSHLYGGRRNRGGCKSGHRVMFNMSPIQTDGIPFFRL